MQIVGTNHGGYANQRNISDLPLDGFGVVRARNLMRIPNFLYFKATGNMHRYWGNLHWDAGFSNCDLLHFFNGISLGRKPWISTFETFLPRWVAYGGKYKEWGLKQLAKPQCKQLIALSECSKAIQLSFMEEFPQLKAEIMPKISVIHPSQAVLIDNLDQKPPVSEGIKLVLVGADFFRKGGLETLRAVTHLLEQGENLYLEIVSSLQTGDYASHAGESEKQEATQLINRFPEHIRWHKQLPNSEVLALFKAAHIGLLPTWADTYGYAALEAMATGCPVISTNVRALPEINDNERGWLIEVDKDDWGNAKLDTEALRNQFSQNLTASLIKILSSITEQPEAIEQKAALAIAHIKNNHAPDLAAKRTMEIYQEALKN